MHIRVEFLKDTSIHLEQYAYPIGLETTISTWGADCDSKMMLYTSFLVAPGNAFPFHCNTSSPEIKMALV